MLKHYLNDYVQQLQAAGKAQATIIAYHKDVEQFADFLLKGGKTEPNQVQSEDVQAFREELETLRYSDKSIARKLNSLKSFFQFLMSKGLAVQNPLQQVDHPKYTISPPRVLTPVEYRALRDACKHDARLSAIIELLLQTGLRISELASLRVEDISLPKQELYVQPHASHPDRRVPLNKAAVQAIKNYTEIRPRSKEPVFFLTKSCRPFLMRNIRSAIDRYFKLAGVREAKVNDLRHTFIVEQLRAGVPLVTVSQLVGHKRLSTTERYLQFLDPNSARSPIEIREL